MNRRVSSILFSYAILLLIAGLGSVLYSPATGFGLNWHGKTGLIVCGAGAALSVVFGVFDRKGAKWPLWAGLIMSFLFICKCGSTVFLLLKSLEEHPDERFKLGIFLLAFVASLRAFIFLGLIARHRKDP
ncbi:MAG: hypothetical protein V4726_21565 [Verrucomicrobiota bacterium]